MATISKIAIGNIIGRIDTAGRDKKDKLKYRYVGDQLPVFPMHTTLTLSDADKFGLEVLEHFTEMVDEEEVDMAVVDTFHYIVLTGKNVKGANDIPATWEVKERTERSPEGNVGTGDYYLTADWNVEDTTGEGGHHKVTVKLATDAANSRIVTTAVGQHRKGSDGAKGAPLRTAVSVDSIGW